MPTSPAKHEQLEERLEELTLLAESIAAQVNLIDSFQTENVAVQLDHSATEDVPVELDSSASGKCLELLSLFEGKLIERSEIAKLEVDLARREEKLAGQRKSLTQRFRAERARLQAEILQLESFRKSIGESNEEGSVDSSQANSMQTESRIEKLTSQLEEADEENRVLAKQNHELKSQLADALRKVGDDHQSSKVTEIFELKRKLELALEELQEAKSENRRLQSANTPTIKSGGSWEETKQAMLASLENETQLESCM